MEITPQKISTVVWEKLKSVPVYGDQLENLHDDFIHHITESGFDKASFPTLNDLMFSCFFLGMVTVTDPASNFNRKWVTNKSHPRIEDLDAL